MKRTKVFAMSLPTEKAEDSGSEASEEVEATPETHKVTKATTGPPATDKAGKKTFVTVAKTAAKMSTNKPRISKTKMDLAKALGILGFNSTRWLDASSGLDPKTELDKQHFIQMMEIIKRKKTAAKEKKAVEAGVDTGLRLKKRQPKSADDEVRVLHEAYQFLLKKYRLGEHGDKPNSRHASTSSAGGNVAEEEPQPPPNEPEAPEVNEDDDEEGGGEKNGNEAEENSEEEEVETKTQPAKKGGKGRKKKANKN